MSSAIFSLILLGLFIYELIAIRTNKVPTITEILKGLPLWASVVIIVIATTALVDHVYFQWVVP